VYFLLLVLIISFLLLNRLSSKDLPIKIIFLILALFAGFRIDVGIDYEVYSKFFDYVDNSKKITKEPGFGYIIFYIKKWFGGPQFFFLYFAALTQYFYYRFIKYNSINKELSILIYFCVISFYLYSFNAIRQTLAASIFLFSLRYLEKSSRSSFVIINLITAFLVHMSVLFLVPIFLFVNRKINSFMSLLMIFLSSIIGLFIKYIIPYTHYSIYLEKDTFTTKITTSIYLFLLFSLVIEFTRKKNEENANARIFYNLNLIGVCILLMLISQNNPAIILTIKRLHNYILVSYIVLIPIIIKRLNFDVKSTKIINIFLSFALIFIYSFYIFFLGEKNKLVPYEYNFNILQW